MSRDSYTHGHQEAVLRSHRWRTAGNSAAYLMPVLDRGQRLLDVGCGPGTLTVDLARLITPGEVIGVNVELMVVEEARSHAKEAGTTNVHFISGDFREVGLEPRSFDVVHAHQVLQHLTNPVGALRAMRDLAKPGGVVAARDGDYSAFTWWPAQPLLDQWLEVYVAVARRNAAEPNAGRWLLHWARAAGLSEVSYSSSTWAFSKTPDRRWWADLWAERSVASSFAEQAVSYGIATAGELQDLAEGWHLWAAEPDAVFIVVHGEILASA